MKKVIFLTIFLVSSLYSQSGWVNMSFPSPNVMLYENFFIDSMVGFTVGTGGNILKTTDSGEHWISKNTGSNYTFISIFFTNSNTGWTVGTQNTIYKTTNAGDSWFQQSSAIFGSWNSVFFLDSEKGWCVGGGLTQTILYTTNGGTNWNQQASLTSGTLNDVMFIDNFTGFITGSNGRLLKSTDAGNNWFPIQVNLNINLRSPFFFDANTGFITGEKIMKTTNGGDNWTIIENFGGYKLKFVDSNTGYVTYNNGILYKTTNSGSNWVQSNIPSSMNLFGINFKSGITGWITGGRWTGSVYELEIYKTTNGGNNWILKQEPSKNYYSVNFINSNTGFIFGDNGRLKKTTDKGQSWQWQISNTSVHIYESISLDENLLFTTGYGGVILKTNNQGVNWNVNYLQGAANDIKFINQTTGWACGPTRILKTTNTGDNWTVQLYNSNLVSNSIFFINDQTGWIAGGDWTGSQFGFTYYKRVDMTTDGGVNWNNVYRTITRTDYFKSVSFINNNTGYIVGVGDTLMTSTNGGVNWSVQRLEYNSKFTKIYFTSEDIGWIIGSDGIILKTTNKGDNWFQQNSGVNSTLLDIYCLNGNECWISGAWSTLLKTSNGGGGSFTSIENNQIINSYALSQNYPNPFNPVTNIKFDILKKSNVKIQVYNVLGKEITVLVNEEMNAGTYNVDWDASAYPSGVYFYKLVTDDFTESKKMVLVK